MEESLCNGELSCKKKTELLKSGTNSITKWDSFLLLQSGKIVLTKGDRLFITKSEYCIIK